MNRNEESQGSRIPENSKAMDSKKDVEKSPDAKTDQDFPGYPHYPAKEDIMDQRTGSHRVDANVEDMGSGVNASGVNQKFSGGQQGQKQGHPDDTQAEGETNDMAALDSRDEERGQPQNVSNEDLK